MWSVGKWVGRTENSLGWVNYVLPVFLLGGMFAFLLLLWNWSLRRNVAGKTKELAENLTQLGMRESQIRAMLEAIPDLYFVLSPSGEFLEYHGPKDARLYVEPTSFIGKPLQAVMPEELSRTLLNVVETAVKSGQMQTCEYAMMLGGELHHFEARLSKSGAETVVGIVRDITERKEGEIALQHMSSHDTLTGLYNRNHFELAMSRFQNMPLDRLGVAICDLDGLKLVNDSLGHDQGDHYLKAVAERIRDAFPERAVVARIGGDEFGVLAPDMEEHAFQHVVANLSRDLPDYLSQSINMPVSISIGSLHASKSPVNIVDMMMEADRRMYREKLHRKQSIRHEVIQTLRKMLEVRDFITEGHGIRMESLAVRLSEAMGLPSSGMADIRLFAQFHDIGKIGVPDSLLFKPGPLDPAEYEVMKRHTEIGYHIALSSVDLMPIADWVLKHHEHWDGKGYPLGLVQQEIPLECRILAIVDAYDAMTNDRPYRKAMSVTAALEDIRQCADRQFDPTIVKAFLAMMKDSAFTGRMKPIPLADD